MRKYKKVVVVLGQNLGQIRSHVVKKVKKWALSVVFFHILHEEYLLKLKVRIVQVFQLIFYMQAIDHLHKEVFSKMVEAIYCLP